MQRPTVRLYDLRDQPEHIVAMQRTSLGDSDKGGEDLRELWVPAEELEESCAHIVGRSS